MKENVSGCFFLNTVYEWVFFSEHSVVIILVFSCASTYSSNNLYLTKW